jgi:hypothetical protein
MRWLLADAYAVRFCTIAQDSAASVLMVSEARTQFEQRGL